MNTEVPKKKITLPGLRKLFKLYSYIKPYKYRICTGITFPSWVEQCQPYFSEIIG
jgi:hypothetical protein